MRRKLRHCDQITPCFCGFFFAGYFKEGRGECKYTLTAVNTQPLSPPPPSLARSLRLLPPTRFSFTSPQPITVEQWSVKKFPISKFTHYQSCLIDWKAYCSGAGRQERAALINCAVPATAARDV